MSDVEQGGGTVFTAINISLWPRKGSAAFWYNLKPNGEGDFKTRHAACPVLTGSKWGIYIIETSSIMYSSNRVINYFVQSVVRVLQMFIIFQLVFITYSGKQMAA